MYESLSLAVFSLPVFVAVLLHTPNRQHFHRVPSSSTLLISHICSYHISVKSCTEPKKRPAFTMAARITSQNQTRQLWGIPITNAEPMNGSTPVNLSTNSHNSVASEEEAFHSHLRPHNEEASSFIPAHEASHFSFRRSGTTESLDGLGSADASPLLSETWRDSYGTDSYIFIASRVGVNLPASPFVRP